MDLPLYQKVERNNHLKSNREFRITFMADAPERANDEKIILGLISSADFNFDFTKSLSPA